MLQEQWNKIRSALDLKIGKNAGDSGEIGDRLNDEK